MQRTNVLVSLLLFLLFSCNNNKLGQSILTTHNLKSTFITLISDSAYTLKTPKGAIIKIDAKSFAVSSKTKVLLEIKEASTLQDILLAGLTTESNGKPLKSGGMIYINATADGKAIALLQTIKIAIPTEVYDNKMQLFKGDILADSSINWVNPQPLDTGLTIQKLQEGRALFMANCASCHKPNQEFVAPMLAGSRERAPDKDWPYRFTINTTKMIEQDAYAKQLKNKYTSIMASFPNLSRENVNAILDYCDNEAALNPFILPETQFPITVDEQKPKIPCGYDTIYYAKPDTEIIILPTDTAVVKTSTKGDKETAETAAPLQKGVTTPVAPLTFTYQSNTTGMYNIAIKVFGWYNIDAFVDAYTGLTDVRLKAQIQFESEMTVYLLCPDKKLLTEATKENTTTYIFNKNNGTIPLFLNDKAVILAFGSKGEKIFYGTASFNIKSAQTITIAVKETTEAELQSFIKENKIDGIEIDLNKKEDFKIKEKPCDEVQTDSAKLVKK